MLNRERMTRRAAGLLLLVLAAACAEAPTPENPLPLPEECQPGVGEISEMGTVVPPNC